MRADQSIKIMPRVDNIPPQSTSDYIYKEIGEVNYGGMCLDEDALHVNIPESSVRNASEVEQKITDFNSKNRSIAEKVIFHNSKYTVSELKGYNDALMPHLSDLGITAIGLNEVVGKLDIFVSRPDIEAEAKLSAIVPADCMQIINEDMSLINEPATEIILPKSNNSLSDTAVDATTN